MQMTFGMKLSPLSPGAHQAAFTLRGLLIVLAVLCVLADGFMAAVRTATRDAVRNQDFNVGPRFIIEAWQAEQAKYKTGLPPETLSDVYALAAYLARAQGLTGVRTWVSPLDPVVKVLNYDLHGSILAEGDKSQLTSGFGDAPLLWAVALVPNITELPPETPVMWTRGLQPDGTWWADAPYGTWGGCVGYASGAMDLFRGKVTDLVKWGTKIPTDNIAEALPPGTHISEYKVAPEMAERIRDRTRRRELQANLGVAGGLLIVGLGCAGTTFGRRHWATLSIIGGSVMFQWWLAVR